MERPIPGLRPVWLTGLLLFIAALSGRASTSEYVNYVSGPLVADVSTVITVADDFHGWLVANPGQVRMWHGPVANRVRLRYTGADNNNFGQDDWELTVDFIVSYWDAQTAGTSAPTGTATGSVTVSYDATAGTFYTDEAVFKIPGGHRMEVDVTQATFLVNGATAPPGYPFPTDVELEAAIEIERYFDLDVVNEVPQVYGTVNSTDNTLLISWDYVEGAEAYDVEWLHIGLYNSNNATTYIEDRDYTRITTTGNWYGLNLAFPDGYVLYRVRAVGKDPSDIAHRREGQWTPNEMSGNLANYVTVTGYEADRNWRYEASYSEQARRQEVVSYFDGFFRERQTVGYSQSEQTAIVGETVYDYEGRPVVQTMPAPSLDRGLKFYELFNTDATGNPYSADNFDNGVQNTIEQPEPLSSISGAGQYYSGQNPAIDEGFNSYLPDAGGFAYVRTLVGRDGRVSRQSGAGSSHKMGSGHETTYFYGTPGQEKLDKLFGTEAGYARNYRYKMVRDANGQYTVTYMNKSGQVIATSLVGEVPSEDGGTTTMVDGLAESQNSKTYVAELHDYNELKEEGMVITRSLPVYSAGDYTFNYSLTQGQYEAVCKSTLHDCEYILRIEIFNSAGEKLNDNQGILHTDISINPAHLGTGNFIVNFPSPGTYKLVKTLSVDEKVLKGLVDNFIDEEYLLENPACITSLSTLQSTHFNSLNMEDCGTCMEYCEKGATDAGLTQGTQAWDDFVADCFLEECDIYNQITETNCSVMLDFMEGDLSPGGQYFDNLYYKNTTVSNSWLATYISNMYQGSNTVWQDMGFRDANNTLLTSWAAIRSNWQDGWALEPFDQAITITYTGNGYPDYSLTYNSLVEFHPEYCRYEWCEATISSDLFDIKLFKSNDYQWASTNGYLGADIIDPLLGNDAYFNGLGSNYYNDILDEINDYQGSGVSMMDKAGTDAACTSCDAQWQWFRSHYLSTKSMIQQGHRTKLDENQNTSIGFGCPCLLDKTTPPDNIGDYPLFFHYNPSIPAQQFLYDRHRSGYLFTINEPCVDQQVTVVSQSEFEAKKFASLSFNQMSFCAKSAVAELTIELDPSGAPYALSFTADLTIETNTGVVDKVINIPLSYTAAPTAEQIASDIVAAINSNSNTPYYFASNDGGNSATIRIYPEYGLGTFRNNYKAVLIFDNTDYYADGEDGNLDEDLFEGGVDEDGCVNPTPADHCTCELLNNIEAYYNTYTPTPNYPTWQDYAVYLINDAHPGLSTPVTSVQVSNWYTNCERTSNTDPEYGGVFEPQDDLYNYEPLPAWFGCEGDPCEAQVMVLTNHHAHHEYRQQIDDLEEAFRSGYLEACFSETAGFGETFTMTYSDKEYHFTLYYHDQAGNLVRTVPPEGVDIGFDASGVDDKRALKQTDVPGHTMITYYRYNSYNQVVLRKTPDEGEILYWYDDIGRLKASQNENQAAAGAGEAYVYSYTEYDGLGRIVESGQLTTTVGLGSPAIADAILNSATFPWDGTYWTAANTTFEQVNHTIYDEANSTALTGTAFVQEEVRSRVSYVVYDEDGDFDGSTSNYEYATFFSYDIHGNVKELIHDLPELTTYNQDIKHISFDYELVSGNVLSVAYQGGDADQFYHRYTYDADNRLKEAWTSRDGEIWDQDEKYFYYLHGPLARTETGHNKVQGTDYAYTLHGWLKGVNSNTLDWRRDMGKDGAEGPAYDPGQEDIHKYVADDAYGFTLGYYKGDYAPIKNIGATDYFEAGLTNGAGTDSDFLDAAGNLYNGNITHMVTAIYDISSPLAAHQPAKPQGTVYRYDQLQRLTKMTAFNIPDVASNSWMGVTATTDYYTEITYDGNGNIKTLDRNGIGSVQLAMDEMEYDYIGGTNMLQEVTENAPDHLLYDDIKKGTANHTYTYDELGQLTSDQQEDISQIEWTAYRKVKSVTFTDGRQLLFKYDPGGNRYCKSEIVEGSTSHTYYIYTPSGQVMATYKVYEGEMYLGEHGIYGSSRVGMVQYGESAQMYPNQVSVPTQDYSRKVGLKNYELTNHLGNVLAVVTDQRWGHSPVFDFFDDGTNQQGWAVTHTGGSVVLNVDDLNDNLQIGFPTTASGVGAMKSFETVEGKRYKVSIDFANLYGNTAEYGAYDGSGIATAIVTSTTNTNGTYEFTFVAQGTQSTIAILNPLAVSGIGFDVNHVQVSEVGYRARIVVSQDYYAFGMVMPGRNWSSPGYSYGFNGMEKDNEWKGANNHYTTHFRQYDPRLGRWFSPDPVRTAWESPYAAFRNNPIYMVDPHGNSPMPGDPPENCDDCWQTRNSDGSYTGEAAIFELDVVEIVFDKPSKWQKFWGKVKDVAETAYLSTRETVRHSAAFGVGVANGVGSNMLFGIGRGDPAVWGDYELSVHVGQMFGDGLSMVIGAGEMVIGGVMVGGGVLITGGSLGTLTVVGGGSVAGGLAVGAHGTTTLSNGFNNLIDGFQHFDQANGTPSSDGSNAARSSAKIPVGRSGNVMSSVAKNSPTTIGGRKFTGHALDQMQSRGIISPTSVLDVIKNPARTFAGNRPGTTVFIRDNLKVVTNKAGDVMTVIWQ